jgi:hypothetical protein
MLKCNGKHVMYCVTIPTLLEFETQKKIEELQRSERDMYEEEGRSEGGIEGGGGE